MPATPGGRLIRAGEGGRDEAIVPLGRGGVGGNINIIINIDNNFEGTDELRRTVKRTVSESLRERGLIGVG